MRTLAFDGRMGASGDMLLAALLDAGADRSALSPVEDALGVRYAVETTTKNGIEATAVDVLLTDDGPPEGDGADQSADRDGADPSADRDGRDAPADHEHDHGHEQVRAEGHGPTRTFAEVIEVVESMDLPAGVAADAKDVFRILGEAEAAVHGADVEETHFHEVGADDAIADVVGVSLLLDDLGPDRIVTTPLSAGGGEVETDHGTYPVPTPAVVEIAGRAGWSLRGGPVEAELLTPTGAAILAGLAEGVDALPEMTVAASGYGAGGYSFDAHPNVLRAVLGEADDPLDRDAITVLETNLDDASPEVLGGLQETLSAAGALDVTVLPATMKKSRPGHLVKVVCKPADARQVARRLAAETGTLGVREHGAGHRWIADREVRTATVAVDGQSHEVAVKVGLAGDDVTDVSAEFDDALAVARETDLPVREVMRRAEAAVRGD